MSGRLLWRTERDISITNGLVETYIVDGPHSQCKIRRSSSALFTTKWTPRRQRFLGCSGSQRPPPGSVRYQFPVQACSHMGTAMVHTLIIPHCYGRGIQISQYRRFAGSSELWSCLRLGNQKGYSQLLHRMASLRLCCMENRDATRQFRSQWTRSRTLQK